MKTTTRIATAAAALALFAAPAAFAAERGPHHRQAREDACSACMSQRAHCAAAEQGAEEKVARPSAPEYPVFTDQG